jgi:spermidine synthase
MGVIPDNRKAAIELTAISFLSLFLELALIRFINSNVQVVAYFNNFLVLSAFLGLGFGSILSDRKYGKEYDLFLLFPVIFALTIASIKVLGIFGTRADLAENVIWVGTDIASPNLPAYLVIILVFWCNCLFFMPLGFRLGQSLNKFENRLLAYALDLVGSIFGVLSFAVASYLQTAPYLWFAVGGLITIFLLGKVATSRRYFPRVLFVAVGIAVAFATQNGKWSPYYNVEWQPYRGAAAHSDAFLGYMISVDKLRIQDALRFSVTLANHPQLGAWMPYYRLPYHFRRPHRVLILGGGCGNDAAVALRNGAEKVDVVEIDPVIIKLGYTLHPLKPYLDPRVRAINDDARAFLREDQGKYDLIVMNALDSHHQLAGLSTLRLESFIYTVEAFRDVRKHMDADSIFLVHLGSTRKWMGERLYWSLTKAFGAEPRLFTTSQSPFGSIAFVYGPAGVLQQDRLSHLEKLISPSPKPFRRVKDTTVLATDDWPHLYLARPGIPKIYFFVLSLITVVSALALTGAGGTSGVRHHIVLFFLGAGFMLLETRSITSIALFFGSTWIVNAIVIGAILVMISAGNILMLLNIRIPLIFCFLGLFVSLALGYIVPPYFILSFSYPLRVLLTAAWFGLTIFFASIIFSYSFRNVQHTSTAFGTNLLGVVLGGIIEYSSMVFGLNALYLLAIFLYACALFFGRKQYFALGTKIS